MGDQKPRGTAPGDPGLEAILDLGRARLARPPREDEADVANAEPDAQALAWAAAAPKPLAELFEIGAKHLHVNLGLWEIWSGHFDQGIDFDGDVPDGFDAEQAVTIAGTGGGEKYALVNWDDDGYRVYVWDFEGGEIERIGNFTQFVDWVRESANNDAYDDDLIELVNDSELPGLLSKLGLDPFSPE